jgi:hypothetical protein
VNVARNALRRKLRRNSGKNDDAPGGDDFSSRGLRDTYDQVYTDRVSRFLANDTDAEREIRSFDNYRRALWRRRISQSGD